MLHKDSDKLKELIKAFQSAEQQVKSVVLSTRAKDLKEYQLRVDKRLDKVNIDLTKKSIDWAKKDMPVAYKDGVKSVDKGYSKAKIDANEIESTYIQLAQHIQHATDNQKQNIRNAIDRAEKENSYGATVGNVKDIIQEELAKDNPTMVVTYSNGAKMPLSAHAEMLARTSRIIAENQGSFARCGELGLDLVRCTTVPNCCPYCKKYEGKVYSISGKDKRFPALYETALQRGYDIMHPNCRHEFIPFIEDFEPKEELKKIIEDSNHFEDLDKDDKLFKIYNKDQALHKQWIAEHREYDRLKEKLGDKMPYSTLAGFRRARRREHQSNTLKYARLATKSYQKGLKLLNKNAIINKEKQRQVKDFVQAKTKEEAEKYISNYTKSVSYDGVDNIVSLNQTNRTFSYLSEKYSIKPISISTKMRSKTAGAEAHGGVLNINKEMLKNPKGFWKSSTTDWQKTCDARIENQKNENERNIKSAQSNLQRAIESGGDETNIRYYKSVLRKAENQAKKDLEIELDKKNYSRHNVIYKDREVECTITHETGHIIADQYFGQITNRLFCNDYMEQTNTKKRQIILQTYRQAKENKDIYKISAYAKKNEIEFFAESFTMYELKVEKLPEYINKMFEEVLK